MSGGKQYIPYLALVPSAATSTQLPMSQSFHQHSIVQDVCQQWIPVAWKLSPWHMVPEAIV